MGRAAAQAAALSLSAERSSVPIRIDSLLGARLQGLGEAAKTWGLLFGGLHAVFVPQKIGSEPYSPGNSTSAPLAFTLQADAPMPSVLQLPSAIPREIGL